MSIVIHFKFPDGFEQDYELKKQLLIGRDQRCDVVLGKPSISSRHAKIFSEDGKIIFRDLDSTNGSFHRGNRITEIVMRINDEIRIEDISIAILTAALSEIEVKMIGKNLKHNNMELTLPRLENKKI